MKAIAAKRCRLLVARASFATAPIAAAVAVLVLAAPASAATQKCNGAASLCDRAFDHVVLPATHNSMSAASLGWAIPNQPVDVAAQLKDGIRGLLLDTHYGHDDGTGKIITDKKKTSKSKTYLCHEACEIGATPLVDVLRDIRDFLKKSPDNVLLIDQEDYITPRDFAAQVKKAGLLKYVYQGKTSASKWPTLRAMIASHQQVVMLAEHVAKGVSWYHLDYDGIVQETDYNWDTPDLITEPAKWEASCAPNRGGTQRLTVPAEPLVAAGRAQARGVGGRQRDRHAGRARARVPQGARADADDRRRRHVPQRRALPRRAQAQRDVEVSQSRTACFSAGMSLARLWLPLMRTTLRRRAVDDFGTPNGSDRPWTTRTGTPAPSSSGRRVFSGRPGGCSGNARQRTAPAPVAVAVRQATRAPDERPPEISSRPLNGPSLRCSITAIHAASSWGAGAGDLRPATR